MYRYTHKLFSEQWDELDVFAHVFPLHMSLRSPLRAPTLWSAKQQQVLSCKQQCVQTGHRQSLQTLQRWVTMAFHLVAALIWVSLAFTAITFCKMCRKFGVLGPLAC